MGINKKTQYWIYLKNMKYMFPIKRFVIVLTKQVHTIQVYTKTKPLKILKHRKKSRKTNATKIQIIIIMLRFIRFIYYLLRKNNESLNAHTFVN